MVKSYDLRMLPVRPFLLLCSMCLASCQTASRLKDFTASGKAPSLPVVVDQKKGMSYEARDWEALQQALKSPSSKLPLAKQHQLIKNFISKYPSSLRRSGLEVQLGKLLGANPIMAKKWFSQAVVDAANPEQDAYARVWLAHHEWMGSKAPNALKTLEPLLQSILSVNTTSAHWKHALKAYSLGLRIALELELFPQWGAMAIGLIRSGQLLANNKLVVDIESSDDAPGIETLSYMTDIESRLKKDIVYWMNKIPSPLMEETRDLSIMDTVNNYPRYFLQVWEGCLAAAKSTALEPYFMLAYGKASMVFSKALGTQEIDRFLKLYPQHELAAQAHQMLLQHGSDGKYRKVSALTIGVLLPLSGKYQEYAERIKAAIELSVSVFYKPSMQAFEILWADAGESNQFAVQVLEQWVEQKRVAMVLGPLMGSNIERIWEAASRLHIPLMSLTRRGSQTLCEYCYQAGLTEWHEVQALARWAVEVKKWNNFAIVASQAPSSYQLGQLFWDAVEKLGGKVVDFETYSASESDFRDMVDRVLGLNYRNVRSGEIADLADIRNTLKIRQRSYKTEIYFSLKPMVNFDALFIADGIRAATQIMPTFAYRDVDNIPFLGLSSWNSANFIERAGTAANNSYFADTAFTYSATSQITAFKEAFFKKTQFEASSLEAIAYDAAWFVQDFLQDFCQGSSPHSACTNVALAVLWNAWIQRNQKVVYQGLTGAVKIEHPVWDRHLSMVTFRQGQPVLLKP